MIANIAEFLLNDLDYMVSMRCVPHQSYKDPAEHVMATLNLGQQCLALARSTMSNEEEAMIKSANSMNAIRRVIQAQDDGRFLAEAIRLSTKECVRNLSDIYEKCVFAGRHVQVHDAATEMDVARVHQACNDIGIRIDFICTRFMLGLSVLVTQIIQEKIDSEINLTKKSATTWKELEKSDALTSFLETHAKLGTYKMTLMKCADVTCKFHKPRRMSSVDWNDLHPFPDAQLTANGTKATLHP